MPRQRLPSDDSMLDGPAAIRQQHHKRKFLWSLFDVASQIRHPRAATEIKSVLVENRILARAVLQAEYDIHRAGSRRRLHCHYNIVVRQTPYCLQLAGADYTQNRGAPRRWRRSVTQFGIDLKLAAGQPLHIHVQRSATVLRQLHRSIAGEFEVLDLFGLITIDQARIAHFGNEG